MTGFDPLDLSSTPAVAPLVPLLPIRLRRTVDLTLAPGYIVHRYPGRRP